jgi:translation initiation factor 2-alpha kinase 4
MVHEVVAAVAAFLEARNEKPESLLEQGINRRTREEEALRSLRMDAASMGNNGDDDDDDDDVDPPNISVVPESSRNVSFSASQPEAPQKATSSLRNPSPVEKGQSWLREFISTIDDDADDDNDDDDEDHDDTFMDEGRLHAFSVSDASGFGREAMSLQSGGHSRYLQEFVEIGQLGTGASGQVCKVRNRLDRRVYAVKKIDLTSAADNAAAGSKIRREVTTLSRLIHKHVVRYFAAWVEQYDHAASQQSSESASSSASAAALGVEGMPYRVMDEPSLRDIDRSSRYSTDSSEDEPTPTHKSADRDRQLRVRNSTYNKFFHYGSSSSDEESDVEETAASTTGTVTGLGLPAVAEEPRSPAPPVLPTRRCLFIQMEYCYTTLRQVVDNGKLWRQHEEIFKLLRQVLEALLYVHERGVIHRDLKV